MKFKDIMRTRKKNFENYLLNNSNSLNIPIIATQEVFYINKEMFEAHDALRCIGEKSFIDDKNRFKLSDQHFLKKQEEIVKFIQIFLRL